MNILKHVTNNYLKLNKKRTIATIIGIIISAAMVTAVTSLSGSFQEFMISSEEATGGAWEAEFSKIEYSNAKDIKNSDKFKSVFITSDLGTSKNPLEDDNKHFIKIRQYDEGSLYNYAVRLAEGNYPKNSNEIMLSETYFSNSNIKVGDKITLTLGKRMLDGSELGTSSEYQNNEKFEEDITKEFTVVRNNEETKFRRIFTRVYRSNNFIK